MQKEKRNSWYQVAYTHTGPYLISSKVGRVAEGEMHKEILLFDRGLATTAVHGSLVANLNQILSIWLSDQRTRKIWGPGQRERVCFRNSRFLSRFYLQGQNSFMIPTPPNELYVDFAVLTLWPHSVHKRIKGHLGYLVSTVRELLSHNRSFFSKIDIEAQSPRDLLLAIIQGLSAFITAA